MSKPSIFVASSSEGLPVAQAVKEILGSAFRAEIWKENVFRMNRSYLDSLFRAATVYDYAVLCLTSDDLSIQRGQCKEAPRDNLLFELGLFLGRIGPDRAFAIADAELKLLSDFEGITYAPFVRPNGGDLKEALKPACGAIKNAIAQSEARHCLGFLPSTALAIGYFENFVKKIYGALLDGKSARIDNKEAPYRSFSLTILMPQSLRQLETERLKRATRDLVRVGLQTSLRDFSVYMNSTTAHNGETLRLLDVPTTLLTVLRAIELAIGVSGEDLEHLQRREIENFDLVLKRLIQGLPEITIDVLPEEG